MVPTPTDWISDPFPISGEDDLSSLDISAQCLGTEGFLRNLLASREDQERSFHYFWWVTNLNRKRWTSKVQDLVKRDMPVSVCFAFAYALLLRWLTPIQVLDCDETPLYRGWLDGKDPIHVKENSAESSDDNNVEYVEGMNYNIFQGFYEFTSDLKDSKGRPLVDYFYDCRNKQPLGCQNTILEFLLNPEGGNLKKSYTGLSNLVVGISVFYARLLAGDGMLNILHELIETLYEVGLTDPCDTVFATPEYLLASHKGQPLAYRPISIPDNSALMNVPLDKECVEVVVTSEVASTIAIDLHTHLLPASHGPLCLWGIDELLTYHYLVAEYFITAPASMTPELFYSKSKQQQADIIWDALFVQRLPMSEACRGVITTLVSLGLEREVETRNLPAIRKYYQKYRKDGSAGAERFCEEVFSKAGIAYAIMTNIPFDAVEASYWKPHRVGYSKHFRSAIRVDPLLTGDRETIEANLRAGGYNLDLEGARQYLRDWCSIMNPEYMMASTPHDFVLPQDTLSSFTGERESLNPEALQEPFSFIPALSSSQIQCRPTEDEVPSIINEESDFLTQVLMPVCEELDLPLALKVGAHRGLNPELKAAGDGIVAFADAAILARLCRRFPNVRFLVTFLSRNNQHEACVLASKFRNLHLYGCWWYCNNPSIIEEISTMRIELLGTAFTAQHSDARVLDQLLYKWSHSRAVIAKVLSKELIKLICSGCKGITRRQVRRDVRRLFRSSYEEFMAKSLKE